MDGKERQKKKYTFRNPGALQETRVEGVPVSLLATGQTRLSHPSFFLLLTIYFHSLLLLLVRREIILFASQVSSSSSLSTIFMIVYFAFAWPSFFNFIFSHRLSAATVVYFLLPPKKRNGELTVWIFRDRLLFSM